MRHLTTVFATLIASTLFSGHAMDWPCWRGPDGLGVSAEKNLPVHWSAGKNVAWKVALPGRGASSPVIVGERVYVTTQTEENALHVLAIERATGKLAWDREIARGNLPANKLHNMATPTPVSDGEHVWVLFGTGDLACLDRAGTLIWKRNLVKDYGAIKTNHGYGSSPMLDAGKLFVVCMHQGPSYVLALDARTGENLWKKDRHPGPKDEAQDSYSTPLFLRQTGRAQLVVAGAECINAYDSTNGEELWNRGGLKVAHPYGRTIAGPAAGEDVVVAVASGFQNRGYTVALRSDRQGKLDEKEQLWKMEKFSTDCPTPVIYQGHLFSIRDDGMASCVELKTGAVKWQERLFSANVKVSPVAGDGKIYFLSGQGNCYVVEAAAKLKILATNEFNEATLSTPAMNRGRLLIRTEANLYAVGK